MSFAACCPYKIAYNTVITWLTMKVTTSTSSAALLALAHLAHSASALPASSAHLQRREATGTITPMCYTVALPSGLEYKLSVAWPTMVEPKATSRVRKYRSQPALDLGH